MLGAFFLAYALLVYLGYALKESAHSLTIIWPAAGLLFITLVLTPLRQWGWIVPLQLAAEVIVGQLQLERADGGWSALFLLGNLCDGVVGALLVKRWIGDPTAPRLAQVAKVITATAAGSAAGALLGALGAVLTLQDESYLRQWQLWWAGNWLGSLAVAPVVLAWAVRWRFPHLAARSGSRDEIALLGALVLGTTWWIFGAPPGSPVSVLHLPFVPLALLVIAAFRLAPRWVFVMSTAAILLAASLASRGLGPFAAEANAFGRVLGLQIYLATVAAFTFMIAASLLEKNRMMTALTLSRERYENFVARSTEAVWRIELREPMPLGLDLPAQIAWLKEHAYIAECNRAYRHLFEGHAVTLDEWQTWRGDVPWATIYLEHLDTAARQEYSMDGLRFSLADGEHWLASFSGVVENGKLARVWGVARDITELVQLNEQVEQEQARLQSYAQALSTAEERARRATAVDLHDGIGQLLVSLSMSVDVAAAQAAPESRPLFDEMRNLILEILGRTRSLIADLSPPVSTTLDWARPSGGSAPTSAPGTGCTSTSSSRSMRSGSTSMSGSSYSRSSASCCATSRSTPASARHECACGLLRSA
jgi:integral membrane sensor domain MASE1